MKQQYEEWTSHFQNTVYVMFWSENKSTKSLDNLKVSNRWRECTDNYYKSVWQTNYKWMTDSNTRKDRPTVHDTTESPNDEKMQTNKSDRQTHRQTDRQTPCKSMTDRSERQHRPRLHVTTDRPTDIYINWMKKRQTSGIAINVLRS